MASVSFPNNPSNGDTITSGGITYTYNTVKGVWRDSVTEITGGLDSASVISIVDSDYILNAVGTISYNSLSDTPVIPSDIGDLSDNSSLLSSSVKHVTLDQSGTLELTTGTAR